MLNWLLLLWVKGEGKQKWLFPDFASFQVEFSLYENLNISFSLICIHRELLLWLLAFMNLGSLLWNPAFCIYQLITNISKNQKLFLKNSCRIHYNRGKPQFIQIFSFLWIFKLFSNKVTNQK